MLQQLYTIYDVKLATHSVPFARSTEADALRYFGDLSRDVNAVLCKHPEDYSLYSIAVYDTDTGVITPHASIVCLVTASQLLSKSNVV